MGVVGFTQSNHHPLAHSYLTQLRFLYCCAGMICTFQCQAHGAGEGEFLVLLRPTLPLLAVECRLNVLLTDSCIVNVICMPCCGTMVLMQGQL
jgi:hypothetical protein